MVFSVGVRRRAAGGVVAAEATGVGVGAGDPAGVAGVVTGGVVVRAVWRW